MMYNNKLVACLKAAGKVLREVKDTEGNTTCYIPFGSEYAINLKNLNTLRANVKISIDGNDVFDGSSLVLRAGQSLDLERTIKNGNLNIGNKFKFIERTAKVEKARGIGGEDGLIRIEFGFEKYVAPIVRSTSYYSGLLGDSRGLRKSCTRGISGSSAGGYADYSADLPVAGAASAAPSEEYSFSDTLSSSGGTAHVNTIHDKINHRGMTQPNEAGITVAGALSEQQFHQAEDFQLDPQRFVIILKLLGETSDGVEVQAPVTVKTKKRCVTCDTVNTFDSNFCSDCGTSLTIV
jgi:hypothetical protein